MNRPAALVHRQEVDDLGLARITHVKHGDATRERIADEGVTLVDHYLRAVSLAALVGEADEAEVVSALGLNVWH